MKLGENGKKLIKSFEGCRLTAYKPVPTEKYWTIGWGHYGANIHKGQVITQKQADALFDKDIQVYVNHVNALGMKLNQNQFDALVSFCYNCGVGNLNRLCSDRSIVSINKWITAYNKGGGNVLQGLVRRRNAEKELFNTPVKKATKQTTKDCPQVGKEQYYTNNPKKVKLLKSCNLYTSVEFNDHTKSGIAYPEGTVFTIVKIGKSKAGTTRLKTASGYWISANKDIVKKV